MSDHDSGRVLTDRAGGLRPEPAAQSQPVGAHPSRDDYDDYDDYYDDDRIPENAEWCDRCQGMGIANCYCGGDQCYCENYGEMECPTCNGEGWWVPTPAQIARRAEMAKTMREIMTRELTDQSSPGTQSDSGAGPSLAAKGGSAPCRCSRDRSAQGDQQ